MTFRHQLEAWLLDRPRQRLTQAGIDRFAGDWNDGPFRRRFAETLAALPSQDAETIAAAAHALFADDRWVGAAIDRIAAKLDDDPYFDPPFRAVNNDIHTGLVLIEDPRVSIAVGVTRVADLAAKKTAKRGSTSIGFSGRMSVLKFVRAGGARISLWAAPTITAAFSARAAGQCARTGERRLADGDILTIDGRREGYVIEQARANMLVLQAEISLDAAPVSVEYDSATLAYVGCSATGDGASRIQMLATLVRKLGCDAAFPTLASFLDHPDFFVRWHVMRELLGIDANAALPHLKRMAARDPHEDVRRAARAVLDLREAPAQRRAA